MKRPSSRSRSPSPKASRTMDGSSSAPIYCTYPPTCSSRPTALGSTRELEAHYAKYHAWVCQAEKCSKVFPDERFLELHHTECHDTIAALRKERGEKIFACFLQPSVCSKTFSTPKTRRLHLIAAHDYPKEYFFAVTNKGIGGLLAKWGDGAGMIRGKWKPRTDQEKGDDHDEIDEDADGDDGAEEVEPTSKSDSKVVREEESTDPVDMLATSFQNTLAISPVPNSIQFGRGAKRGARGRGRGKSYHTILSQGFQQQYPNQDGSLEPFDSVITNAPMHFDSYTSRRGRGGIRGSRGGRGRGRGGGSFEITGKFYPSIEE
ncbi:hypothetical protein GYMLUDRAFT_49123 [Collybiopsis luxurians FD-317 M1]|uniref:C2H2-type domain-containing protein n=1 Tax=Collybiopsis luxurians FD-317 M1 TaxID=944289 RepID=A0A0D0CGB9_9AGAR|nr:hypothetical protein GYMLUDRAFT_49123 [Collybiopsis luxurians FD-317 M1]